MPGKITIDWWFSDGGSSVDMHSQIHYHHDNYHDNHDHHHHHHHDNQAGRGAHLVQRVKPLSRAAGGAGSYSHYNIL